MKMTQENDETSVGAGQDAVLAPFLTAAQAARPQPTDALMARIMADARAEQPRLQSFATPRRGAQPGAWQRILAAFGGLGGLGGLSTAALVGLWIGIATPWPLAGVLDGLPAAVLGGADEADTLVAEMLPEFDDFLTEG